MNTEQNNPTTPVSPIDSAHETEKTQYPIPFDPSDPRVRKHYQNVVNMILSMDFGLRAIGTDSLHDGPITYDAIAVHFLCKDPARPWQSKENWSLLEEILEPINRSIGPGVTRAQCSTAKDVLLAVANMLADAAEQCRS